MDDGSEIARDLGCAVRGLRRCAASVVVQAVVEESVEGDRRRAGRSVDAGLGSVQDGQRRRRAEAQSAMHDEAAVLARRREENRDDRSAVRIECQSARTLAGTHGQSAGRTDHRLPRAAMPLASAAKASRCAERFVAPPAMTRCASGAHRRRVASRVAREISCIGAGVAGKFPPPCANASRPPWAQVMPAARSVSGPECRRDCRTVKKTGCSDLAHNGWHGHVGA